MSINRCTPSSHLFTGLKVLHFSASSLVRSSKKDSLQPSHSIPCFSFATCSTLSRADRKCRKRPNGPSWFVRVRHGGGRLMGVFNLEFVATETEPLRNNPFHILSHFARLLLAFFQSHYPDIIPPASVVKVLHVCPQCFHSLVTLLCFSLSLHACPPRPIFVVLPLQVLVECSPPSLLALSLSLIETTSTATTCRLALIFCISSNIFSSPFLAVPGSFILGLFGWGLLPGIAVGEAFSGGGLPLKASLFLVDATLKKFARLLFAILLRSCKLQ